MESELEYLRAGWREAMTRADALERARVACKEEARSVAAALETAALGGDAEQCCEIMEDLKVIEARYTQLGEHAERARKEAEVTAKTIVDYYVAAASKKGPPVDWTPALVFGKKVIYSGWGSTWSDGKYMSPNVELTEPDLQGVKLVLTFCEGWNNTHFSVNSTQAHDRPRLRVQYPAYQGSCWTDIDGERLLGMLRPIFDKNALGAQVAEFCAGLQVLKER